MKLSAVDGLSLSIMECRRVIVYVVAEISVGYTGWFRNTATGMTIKIGRFRKFQSFHLPNNKNGLL